jgi:catechol 2,3-dioxygenase-like lactoylglutathione lyase family enzyme
MAGSSAECSTDAEMSTKFYHAGIVAHEPERLARFYCEVFDCVPTGAKHDFSARPLGRGMGLEGAHIKGLNLLLPGHGEQGPVLEIFRLDEVTAAKHPVDAAGIMHLAFSVDDVASTLERLQEAGGQALGEIVVLDVPGEGSATMVYARDPEGNIVEIQRWDKS